MTIARGWPLFVMIFRNELANFGYRFSFKRSRKRRKGVNQETRPTARKTARCVTYQLSVK